MKTMFFISFIFFSLHCSASDTEELLDENDFFLTMKIDKCHGFFLAKTPNLLGEDMIVIFSSESEKCPQNQRDRVVDCSIFSDRLAVTASCGGKITFINLQTSREKRDKICSLPKSIQSMVAFDNNEGHNLIVFCDETMIFMPNIDFNASIPQMRETCEPPTFKIAPCSSRFVQKNNMVFGKSETDPNEMVVINRLNEQNFDLGSVAIQDLFFDQAGNQFELKKDGQIGLDGPLTKECLMIDEEKSLKKVRFVETHDDLNTNLKVLAYDENDDLCASILELISLEQCEPSILLSKYYLWGFSSHHRPNDVKRIIEFKGNFIVWDGDIISVWGNEHFTDIRVMDGYHILQMHSNRN